MTEYRGLTSLTGGRDVDFDAQERMAWGTLADACEQVLTSVLDPHHPERHQFQTMLRECRQAAGRQNALALAGGES